MLAHMRIDFLTRDPGAEALKRSLNLVSTAVLPEPLAQKSRGRASATSLFFDLVHHPRPSAVELCNRQTLPQEALIFRSDD